MKKLILFELRKIFSKRLSLIVLVGILLFSVLISFSTYQNKFAFDGVSAEGSGKTAVEIDKEIAAKYEGILTDEKVQQMMNDFAPTHDLHGLNAMYLYQNATQSAVSDVFGNEEIKIGYVDGWLSTSKNMVRVFIVLALAVIIMLAPIFSGEYEGVDNIILTSKYGKTKCATKPNALPQRWQQVFLPPFSLLRWLRLLTCFLLLSFMERKDWIAVFYLPPVTMWRRLSLLIVNFAKKLH